MITDYTALSGIAVLYLDQYNPLNVCHDAGD